MNSAKYLIIALSVCSISSIAWGMDEMPHQQLENALQNYTDALDRDITGAMNSISSIVTNPNFDINAQAPNGQTALHIFARYPYDFRQIAINKNADVNIVDNDGNTPLHIAAIALNEGAIDFLLVQGANAAILNRNGDTPAKLFANNIAKRINEYQTTEIKQPVFPSLKYRHLEKLRLNIEKSVLHNAHKQLMLSHQILSYLCLFCFAVAAVETGYLAYQACKNNAAQVDDADEGK